MVTLSLFFVSNILVHIGKFFVSVKDPIPGRCPERRVTIGRSELELHILVHFVEFTFKGVLLCA